MKLLFIPKASQKRISTVGNYNIMVDCFDLPYNGRQYIYIQQEPESVIPYREHLLKNWNLYYKIYTYDNILLQNCPNAIKYVFGTSTFKSFFEISNLNISKKLFQISSLTGDKEQLIGHKLRKTLYKNKSLFPNNFIFFVSHSAKTLDITDQTPKIYGTKLPLFETFQFSIIIECSQQINYFSEKLIDCLLTRTIPIYWGCPNINEYFDTSGWIFFNDLDILEKEITSEHYSKYTNTIEDNYHKSLHYANILKNLERAGLSSNSQ